MQSLSWFKVERQIRSFIDCNDSIETAIPHLREYRNFVWSVPAYDDAQAVKFFLWLIAVNNSNLPSYTLPDKLVVVKFLYHRIYQLNKFIPLNFFYLFF